MLSLACQAGIVFQGLDSTASHYIFLDQLASETVQFASDDFGTGRERQ